MTLRKVIDMSRIPAGWKYWTSEPSSDDAWRVAIEYKEARERMQNSTFVRIRVIPARGCYWILIREEARPFTARPVIRRAA